jgi:hypothetical protein
MSGKLEPGAELLEEIGAICGLPIPPRPAAADVAGAS